jgi:hypothetical protein
MVWCVSRASKQGRSRAKRGYSRRTTGEVSLLAANG